MIRRRSPITTRLSLCAVAGVLNSHEAGHLICSFPMLIVMALAGGWSTTAALGLTHNTWLPGPSATRAPGAGALGRGTDINRRQAPALHGLPKGADAPVRTLVSPAPSQPEPRWHPANTAVHCFKWNSRHLLSCTLGGSADGSAHAAGGRPSASRRPVTASMIGYPKGQPGSLR